MLIERKNNITILDNYVHKNYIGHVDSLQLITHSQIFRIQLHNGDGVLNFSDVLEKVRAFGPDLTTSLEPGAK